VAVIFPCVRVPVLSVQTTLKEGERSEKEKGKVSFVIIAMPE